MGFDNIIWLGHASFAIRAGSRLVYVDPFRLGSLMALYIFLQNRLLVWE